MTRRFKTTHKNISKKTINIKNGGELTQSKTQFKELTENLNLPGYFSKPFPENPLFTVLNLVTSNDRI